MNPINALFSPGAYGRAPWHGGASMIVSLRELPGNVWARVLILTAIIVAALTGASLATCEIVMRLSGRELTEPGLVLALVLPVMLGGPLSLMHLLRVSQLRMANQQLQVLASTDSLTGCLNRRAFNSLVETQLGERGALLVIDADHFKGINDHCGHDCGDEALRLMADAIRSSIRDGDLVGRIGGEEFGVLLKGAGLDTASKVAERIRAAIVAIDFAPGGRHIALSVSIGGAAHDGRVGFTPLFRAADQRLYQVKQSGRNRIDIARLGDTLPLIERAA